MSTRAGDAEVLAQGVARDIEKVLRSAIANAQQKDGFGGDVERLFVTACYADQGPSQKRVRPAPMGRAFRVVKRTAHLTVQVAERPAVGSRGRRRRGARSRRSAHGRGRGAHGGARRAHDAGQRARGTSRRRGQTRGPESSPVRVPARVQQDVALAVVRRPRLREAAARGPRAARRPEEALRARRRLEDRDRAGGQQAEDRHPHLAARASSSGARARRSTS